MKNIVTHNYAPLRSTFVRCCISEVVGVDVKQRAPQQNAKIQYVTRYGILRHYTATFTFRRQKYKYTITTKYEVLQLRHVVQLKNLRYMFPTCACRSRFLYLALLRERPTCINHYVDKSQLWPVAGPERSAEQGSLIYYGTGVALSVRPNKENGFSMHMQETSAANPTGPQPTPCLLGKAATSAPTAKY